ncbi:3-dehydroquinate synthase [Staphylospora marina]|uniref:3-dehydroquinate synthase n=1 Tax=Staphylospora marina TaxID=2490858 RepID=UPI000F5BF626|nr:3-dehydroquinate synthase [Staphylospora marina]
MKTLTIATTSRTYPLTVGSGVLQRLPELLEQVGVGTERRLMVVTDERVGPLYAEPVLKRLIRSGYRAGLSVIPSGEASKRLAVLESVIGECLRFGLDRRGVILALGGGVVGDLAGFAAAVYMRGIDFVQLPTTLLAHDSSVGGKTGVNHPMGKNLIGAFHQPLAVVYDVDTLRTLPKREVRSGLAEVIKHGLIRDQAFVTWLESFREPLLRLEPDAVTEAVWQGCRIKADVVAADERESGLRAILNYGHTIGHALEAVTHYGAYTHGEAVAIGMAGAARLGGKVLGTRDDVVRRTEELLLSYGLPVRHRWSGPDTELLSVMKRDKKSLDGGFAFVLTREIGRAELIRDVPEDAVREVLTQLREGT